jgi:hypothetical protein
MRDHETIEVAMTAAETGILLLARPQTDRETDALYGRIRQIEEMLTPYIERDQHKFTSETAFHKGVDTLVSFWKLRSESVDRQLGGEIPSTTSGQADSPEMLIDASHLELIDMK